MYVPFQALEVQGNPVIPSGKIRTNNKRKTIHILRSAPILPHCYSWFYQYNGQEACSRNLPCVTKWSFENNLTLMELSWQNTDRPHLTQFPVTQYQTKHFIDVKIIETNIFVRAPHFSFWKWECNNQAITQSAGRSCWGRSYFSFRVLKFGLQLDPLYIYLTWEELDLCRTDQNVPSANSGSVMF